jgi:hypothetical protein
MASFEKAASIENVDVLHKAIEAAFERIEAVKPHMGSTLVDDIPADVWATWDASAEKALVCDSADIDNDAFDLLDPVPHAA